MRRPLALASALVAAGCATLAPAPPGALESAGSVRRYSASARVSLRTAEVRGRARVLLACARPDALRIEVPAPGGLRLLVVARGGRVVALFPGERAFYSGPADAASMRDLLGVALEPADVMDALLGLGSPRLRDYEVGWHGALPRKVRATLDDGGRLDVQVEEAEADPPLSPAAFDPPPHDGYREIGAREARSLWLGR